MRTLLFGSRGYIGQSFLRRNRSWIGSETDIADSHEVCKEICRVRPDVVVNCAGKTGTPNIDWCESHKGDTVRSNVLGPMVLLEQCLKHSIYFVHVGSGCIFDGDNEGNGFSEDDSPNYFGSYYSRSKMVIDTVLKEFPVLVVRLRMPFDGTHHPKSLINKLRRYSRVLDTQNSLTHVPEFITTTVQLMECTATGIFHIVNPGTASPFQIMERYQSLVDPKHRFKRLRPEELPQVALAGRSTCQLAVDKLRAHGLELMPIREALELALRELAESQGKLLQSKAALLG